MNANQQVKRKDRLSEVGFKCGHRAYNRSAIRSAFSEGSHRGTFDGLDFYCHGSKPDALAR